jgi:hypothetical protein
VHTADRFVCQNTGAAGPGSAPAASPILTPPAGRIVCHNRAPGSAPAPSAGPDWPILIAGAVVCLGVCAAYAYAFGGSR